MNKKRWSAVIAMAVLSLALWGRPASASEIELKAVSFLPKDHKLCAMIPVWVERVNSSLKGTAKITWVGGPEVMAGLNQPEAIRKGIFQVGFIPAAFYNTILPEADAVSLSRLDFKQEREKGGLYDYLVERHKKINMIVLGTWLYDPFYLWVSKPVAKLDDLKGRRMRTTAKYDKMMKRLGMVPVTVEPGETYTALQRGLVEGFGWPTIGARDMGWMESTKYVIDIPFYARQNTFFVMNLDSWNKLPKPAQDKILDISVKFEPEMKAHFERAIEAEKKELEKIGVKRIKLSAEDTKKFLEAADDAFWDDLEKKVPDQMKTLRKLTGHES